MQTKHIISSNHAGKHRIVYQDWGDENNPNVLICVHGLSRNSRDFDMLASHLSKDYRVIAPDIVGRGQSDWLPDPSLYTLEQYINDMVLLVNDLGVDQIDWLGTSLGGIIGMAIAAGHASPIKRLVLNDIGPIIKKEAIAFLATSLAQTPQFNSLEELTGFLREAYVATGRLEDYHWEHLATHDHRVTPEGTYVRNFDPNITQGLATINAGEDMDMWDLWKAVKCPTLVLHGEQSMILTPAICDEMKALHPDTTVIDIPGVGHTPSLLLQEHIDVVEQWLAKH